MKQTIKNFKKLSGIDSLYFFFESNENYDDLYLDIYDQIETQKAEQIRNEIIADNSSIFVRVGNINLQYLGNSEGFYWLRDDNQMFRIGFKDENKNKTQHNIRVQLEGNGIYTFGITSIINLLKDELLNGFITGYTPVSRVDLNCFVQCDLGFIDKTMFSTRKRKYSTINEIGNANEIQTIYIGKPPFMLRIYNKTLEMKKSKKYDVIKEYFLNNNFDLEEVIFNVEFQMHRSHLKNYSIDSLDDLFPNVEELFKNAMDEIRLIDKESVSKEKLEHNKYEANTHIIWEQIKVYYKINNFLQTSIPLERVKRVVSIFNEKAFNDEIKALLKKGISRGFDFQVSDLANLFIQVKKEMKFHKEIKLIYEDVKEYKQKRDEHFQNIPNGSIHRPLEFQSVKELKDDVLVEIVNVMRENQSESERHYHTFKVAQREAIQRGLLPEVENWRVIDDFPNI